jgi:hypothetical protein
LPLYQDTEYSDRSVRESLAAFLCQGDFTSANALVEHLQSSEVSDVERLDELILQISAQPETAYNSSIKLLAQMDGILQKYCPDQTEHYARTGSSIISIRSRIAALKHARNNVISSYAALMKQSAAENRFDDILETWHQYSADPELRPEGPDDRSDLPKELLDLEASIPEIQEKIVSDVSQRFAGCVERFNAGNLLEARNEFTRILRVIRNLSLQADFPTMEGEIKSYLGDITLILSGNEAVRRNELAKASEYFRAVVHQNDFVARRLEEAKNFARMQSGNKEGE